MAYTKTNWTNTTPINTTNLNNIENGISANDISIGNLSDLTTPVTDTLVRAINSIVESGSNSNGNWIKYADGTMICTRSIDKEMSCNNSWGSLFYGYDSTVYNFAQEFITSPLLYLFAYQRLQSSFWLSNYYNTIITTTGFHNYAIMRATSANNVAYTLNVLAIGRWK